MSADSLRVFRLDDESMREMGGSLKVAGIINSLDPKGPGRRVDYDVASRQQTGSHIYFVQESSTGPDSEQTSFSSFVGVMSATSAGAFGDTHVYIDAIWVRMCSNAYEVIKLLLLEALVQVDTARASRLVYMGTDLRVGTAMAWLKLWPKASPEPALVCEF
jgi:hypothetical protein